MAGICTRFGCFLGPAIRRFAGHPNSTSHLAGEQSRTFPRLAHLFLLLVYWVHQRLCSKGVLQGGPKMTYKCRPARLKPGSIGPDRRKKKEGQRLILTFCREWFWKSLGPTWAASWQVKGTECTHSLSSWKRSQATSRKPRRSGWVFWGMYVLGRTGPRKVFHVFRAGGNLGLLRN